MSDLIKLILGQHGKHLRSLDPIIEKYKHNQLLAYKEKDPSLLSKDIIIG
jgi:hypothetical protein